MRQYTKQEVTQTRTVLSKITCDLCGREAKEANWEAGRYQDNEVTIDVRVHQKEGSNCPEGGYGTEYVVDLCPTCFKTRLIPWLESQGANIKQQDWDW